MLVTMLPLVLLYELSIGLAWLFRPRSGTIRSRWEDWWDEEDDDDEDGPPVLDDPADASDRATPVS
jgi:hypothetical protein